VFSWGAQAYQYNANGCSGVRGAGTLVNDRCDLRLTEKRQPFEAQGKRAAALQREAS
jgi:hypothetical protein